MKRLSSISGRKTKRKRTKKSYIAENCVKLIEAVVAEAIHEYRHLRAGGIVDKLKKVGSLSKYGYGKDSKVTTMRHDGEVVDLLNFLKSPDLDLLLRMCHSPIDGSTLRKRLDKPYYSASARNKGADGAFYI